MVRVGVGVLGVLGLLCEVLERGVSSRVGGACEGVWGREPPSRRPIMTD